MNVEVDGSNSGSGSRPAVVVSGTFTVDPIVDSLTLLLREAGLELGVTVAPYGQVFQELLDPNRLFGRNRDGVNVVLLRLEDWSRDVGAAVGHIDRARSLRNVDDLVKAIRGAADRAGLPLLVGICPPSAAALASTETRDFLGSLTQRLREGIAGAPGVRAVDLPVGGGEIDDPEGDRLGHVPYTPLYFAALGQTLARAVHVLKRPPHKVLVLDCDNTIWKGVVGEDGVGGIELTPRHLELQRFAVAKKDAGMVICLASKNVESDVLEVFQSRADMVLKAEDVVAMKVDWQAKSQNLHALAAELNLGLDSFVFIDDNPVECAEVAASCPGVLALHLPVDDDFPAFVASVWPLDQLTVTEEDRRRTDMYRENLARDRYQKSSGNLGDFLAGLELQIDIAEPGAEALPRFAQLTQRTNQFNFSTRRRSEAEVSRLAAEGKGHRAITVRDRFGDYGLVGNMIFGKAGEALEIDTLLLSCRVLGRGVEHAMMRELAAVARAQGLAKVVAPFIATKKNLPARRFLDSLETLAREEDGATVRYVFATDYLADLAYAARADSADLGAIEADDKGAGEKQKDERKPAPADLESKSARWNRVARELRTPQQILAAIERASVRDRIAPTSGTGALQAPRSESERALVAIWQQVLHLRQVGIQDDYFDIGGTSLQAVTIFARIERELGSRLPLSALTECPTIEALAALLEKPLDVQPLVLLAESAGDAPPLFLVHDADGETLLYRNLAQRLAGERSVYGIQPQARGDTSITCTRIEDMAALYVAEIRRARPHGPYLLGGLCAGGVVAFEMARQLEATNESVRLVAVFDAADVEAQPRPYLRAGRSVGRLREALSAASLLKLPKVVAAKAWGFLSYEVESRARKASRRLAVSTLRLCLDRGLPLPPWARKLPIRDVYTFAESQYRPRHMVREEIVLYRATVGEDADEPYTQIFVDPLLGWGPRSAGGVRAYDVPGGHGSMLQEPNVAVVAERIAAYLHDVDARDPRSGRQALAAGQ